MPETSSPFAKLFEPPSAKADMPNNSVAHSSSAKIAQFSDTASPYQSVIIPPSESSIASSHYVSSGLSAYNTGSFNASGSMLDPSGASGNEKYGSISRTDRRRLGRHLPRIASGEGGWDNDESCQTTAAPAALKLSISSGRMSAESEHSKKRNVQLASRDETPVSETTTTPPSKKKAVSEVLVPSVTENHQTGPTSMRSTPNSKKRSVYLPQTPKASVSLATGIGLLSPRPEVVGAEMKGLMSAVGSLPLHR